MIYFILNLLLAVLMLILSFFVDSRSRKNNSGSLVSNILILSAAAFLMVLAVLADFYAPYRLSVLTKRLVFLLEAILLIQVSFYFLSFPEMKTTRILSFIKLAFFILACYLIFFKFFAITLSANTRFKVTAVKLFKGPLSEYLKWTWYDLYTIIFRYLLPGFSTVLMMLHCENKGDRLDFQRSMINAFGVLLMWLCLYGIDFAGFYVPYFMYLLLYSYGALILFTVFAFDNKTVYDYHLFFADSMNILVKYVAPSVLSGIFYIRLHPLYEISPVLFVVALCIVSILFLYIGDLLSERIKFMRAHRSTQYELRFEKSLAALDYNEDPELISSTMYDIFHKNVDCTTMKVLIDRGTSSLETDFSSDDQKTTLTLTSPVWDFLLNNNIRILFRSRIDSEHIFEGYKKELHTIFSKTASSVLILLNEGQHIVGVIFLGPRENENTYDDYDFAVLNKLYSYFFVYAYYLKNIGNKEVIGTVNREIRMSSQIISSIQENIDPIRNQKIDAGYLMAAAHNLGGEFIDLIRLNGTNHLFVIGKMSGKGISASMSMVIVKSVIRTFLTETHDFKKLVEKINTFVKFSLPKGTLFSGLFGLIDFETDTLYYINCGIPALFLYTRTYNNVIEIQGSGKVLGFVDDVSALLKVKKIKLGAGDVLFSCTDGLINSHSLRGEKFGKDRIQRVITDNIMYPAARIAGFADDELMKFISKERENDSTVLVFKYLAPAKQTSD